MNTVICPTCGEAVQVPAAANMLDTRAIAQRLRAIKSAKRSEQSRINGQKGGRPPKAATLKGDGR